MTDLEGRTVFITAGATGIGLACAHYPVERRASVMVCAWREDMPISRLGKPEDIASMVGFLLSEEAGWITGEVIGVDGGHHLRRGPNLERSFSPEA